VTPDDRMNRILEFLEAEEAVHISDIDAAPETA
jgi:hypothetical protein